MVDNQNYLNITEDEDPLEKFLNKLALVDKENGKRRTFIARLIRIKGDEIYFQSKDKRISMIHRSSIKEISEYVPKGGV